MDEKKLTDLRLALRKVVADMETHAHEANERTGGPQNWAQEDKDTYDRMTADLAEKQKEINQLEGDARAEQLEAARKLVTEPTGPRLKIGRAPNEFWGRRLDRMPPQDREVAKATYWTALACLVWGHLRTGRGQPTDGRVVARELGVPNEVLERFNVGPKEQHLLSESGGAGLGGELVPEDFQAELSRDLAGFSAVLRAGASVRPTNSSVATYPAFQSRTGTDPKQYPTGFAGAWKAEGGGISGGTAPTIQNQPLSQQIKIPVWLWNPDALEITRELLEDTPIALEDEIRSVIVETRGLDYDRAFLLGTGSGEPEGVTSAGVTSVTWTMTDSGTQYNGLVDLYADLAEQYRQDPSAGFIGSSGFLATILKLKDTTDMPFFTVLQVAPKGAVPMTLWGKPIYISEFMPTHTGGTWTSADVACIFASWRHYRVVERRDLMIQRLIERFVPNIGFMATARVGGKVMRPAAFRTLTVA